MVTQDVITFNDTIAANIAYGRHGATQEEIVDAAKRAFAHEFISQMPDGYIDACTPVANSGPSTSAGGPYTLYIPEYTGNFGKVTQACSLSHQTESRAGRGGH